MAGREVEEPDIHLILEYSSGASWGHYTARRANRFVFNVIKMHLEKDRGTLQIKFLNGVYAHLRLCTNLCFCFVFCSCSADTSFTVMTITPTLTPWKTFQRNSTTSDLI